MNIAFCYQNLLPKRGGCETYIADLARRLVADGHAVHVYARRWDEEALPKGLIFHRVPALRRPRFLRPWRFGASCESAMRGTRHEVSIGFDKTWGQDILYPQGGLHLATADHNLNKHPQPLARQLARAGKYLDPAYWSFALLERKQYLGPQRPLVVVNSHMVREHFQYYLHYRPEDLRVVRSAIDPGRFLEHDRPRRRADRRAALGLAADETVALFAAMNYQLKGLDPLLHAVARMPSGARFRLLVVGNPSTSRYEALAEELGVRPRVRFAGFCADMRDSYFAADFLVHPTFYDPCSLVVLEALACGLPVITTAYNGASELMLSRREGHVITTPHDHAGLAEAMTQLLDSGHRLACAQAARRTAASWTFDHHYRQILEVFAEAAQRRLAA